MKDELRGQIMKKIVGLRLKTYSYLKDNNGQGKKAKLAKIYVIKKKLKFEDYKNCLKASQIINTVNYLEKNEKGVDSLKEDKKEFIKNRIILKTHQRFKSVMHNGFTEEINIIALSSNDDKRIQSIDSIETYAHGINKGLMWKKEKIKRINIRKQYKNV